MRVQNILNNNIPEMESLPAEYRESFMSDGLAQVYNGAPDDEKLDLWGNPCPVCRSTMISLKYRTCWDCKRVVEKD